MRNLPWPAVTLATALALGGHWGVHSGSASSLSPVSSANAAGMRGDEGPQYPRLSTVSSVNAASTAPSQAPDGGFKQTVVFGDSLSDDGAYTLAAVSVYSVAPYNVAFDGLPYPEGGQFTVNGAPSGNWTSILAQDLGLRMTPNLVGYGSPQGAVYLTPFGVTTNVTQALCAFALQGSCTDFAEGGSMVRNPDGIGHAQGALTIPVTQQVRNYHAQFGAFNPSQLITVFAGNNDVFAALANLSTQVQSAVTEAVVEAAQAGSPLTQDQIAAVQQRATLHALKVAQSTVAAAADQLAAVVQKIIAMGGRYVMVYTLPDSSLSPFGQSLSGGTTCNNQDPAQPCYILSRLVKVFNQRLLNQLQGRPVKMIDGYALFNQEVAQPAQFGFTNVTTPWCNMQLVPSSLLCNVNTPNAAAGASPSNLGSWLFADTVHPTPAGYQVIAAATLQAMAGFGWAP